MLRFFENLIDPYVSYAQTDTPPRRLWPFLADYLRPFSKVFWATGVFSVCNAVIDVVLIWYVGVVVDYLSQGSPAQVWTAHGTEMLLVAGFILLVRPSIGGVHVALLHNTIMVNFATMIRWRAHSHVLRQPVGWFESDFAGRIANRIMQAPTASGEAVFQVFDAGAFATVTLIGASFMLAEADLRLLVPLLIWLAGYLLLMRWTLRRIGPASQAASDARSAVTGRVVDAYSNIHSVKLSGHHERERDYAREAIEVARQAVAREMRIITKMDVTLTVLNGFLIVSVIGWALALWHQGVPRSERWRQRRRWCCG